MLMLGGCTLANDAYKYTQDQKMFFLHAIADFPEKIHGHFPITRSLVQGFAEVRLRSCQSFHPVVKSQLFGCRHVAMAGVLVVHAVFIRETAGSLQFELGCHVAKSVDLPSMCVGELVRFQDSHEVPDLWKLSCQVLSKLACDTLPQQIFEIT